MIVISVIIARFYIGVALVKMLTARLFGERGELVEFFLC